MEAMYKGMELTAKGGENGTHIDTAIAKEVNARPQNGTEIKRLMDVRAAMIKEGLYRPY